MSSRCGIIGSSRRPELHRRAAALRPPVSRLDAVREVDDARGAAAACSAFAAAAAWPKSGSDSIQGSASATPTPRRK